MNVDDLRRLRAIVHAEFLEVVAFERKARGEWRDGDAAWFREYAVALVGLMTDDGALLQLLHELERAGHEFGSTNDGR